MDKLLAKYAEYPPIEPVSDDLHTSNEGPGSLFSEAGASTSNPFPLPPSSEEEQQHLYSESFPLFRLQHHSDRDPHDWQYSSPEKVCAARADIDDHMLAEFGGYAYPQHAFYNRPSSSGAQSQWVGNVLVECARAVAVSDAGRVKNLMWVLNEISSPYGDADQRLAACFLQALFCRVTGTGVSCHRILSAAAEKTYSFGTLRKMILDYQEASPWTTFGHVAGNASLMEAFEKEMKIHIVDMSSTYCTQWPTLLEALATRADGTPHLRLTTIVISPEESAFQVMKQIMTRLERFARLMGVPFEFSVTHQPQDRLDKLELAELELRPDEVLAITCNHTLHHVSEGVPDGEQWSPRDRLLCTFRKANPKMLVLVEEEMDLVSPNFLTSFCEGLRLYSLLFDSLDESFSRTSSERLLLERMWARKAVRFVACEVPDNVERQQKGVQWEERLRRRGFLSCNFSDDVVDDVRALLKRYREGWGLSINDTRLYLTWKEQVVLCATAWKPIANPSPET